VTRHARSHVLAVLAVAAASALAACDRWQSTVLPDRDALRVKDVVDLTLVSVLNDTLARLVAHIPAAATVRGVAFSTTAGKFVLTGSNAVTVRVAVDPDDPAKRFAATVELLRDKDVRSSLVSATIADFRDTVRVTFP
jgi:hypothetical protein